MAGGRPTKYSPDILEQARNYCVLGATDRDLINFLNISESTLYIWKAKYPEFREATKVGKDAANERVGHSLYSKACGYDKDGKHYPPSDTSMIFWLKNRDSVNWKDVKERIDTHRFDEAEVNPLELARRVRYL